MRIHDSRALPLELAGKLPRHTRPTRAATAADVCLTCVEDMLREYKAYMHIRRVSLQRKLWKGFNWMKRISWSRHREAGKLNWTRNVGRGQNYDINRRLTVQIRLYSW
jgi:hypothetical protein